MEYSLSDIMQVFIWELPMKETDIDIDREYFIIRDNDDTKKIKVKLLFDYFTQNDKIEAVEESINQLLKMIDDEFLPFYNDMDEYYDEMEHEITVILIPKFAQNRKDINILSEELNQRGLNIRQLEEDLILISNKTDNEEIQYNNLLQFLKELKKNQTSLRADIKELQKQVESLEDNTLELENDLIENHKRLDEIISNNEEDTNNKTSELIKTVQSEYDKILSVIDHYHHIHDNPYK